MPKDIWHAVISIDRYLHMNAAFDSEGQEIRKHFGFHFIPESIVAQVNWFQAGKQAAWKKNKDNILNHLQSDADVCS